MQQFWSKECPFFVLPVTETQRRLTKTILQHCNREKHEKKGGGRGKEEEKKKQRKEIDQDKEKESAI